MYGYAYGGYIGETAQCRYLYLVPAIRLDSNGETARLFGFFVENEYEPFSNSIDDGDDQKSFTHRSIEAELEQQSTNTKSRNERK